MRDLAVALGIFVAFLAVCLGGYAAGALWKRASEDTKERWRRRTRAPMTSRQAIVFGTLPGLALLVWGVVVGGRRGLPFTIACAGIPFFGWSAWAVQMRRQELRSAASEGGGSGALRGGWVSRVDEFTEAAGHRAPLVGVVVLGLAFVGFIVLPYIVWDARPYALQILVATTSPVLFGVGVWLLRSQIRPNPPD